ncbi:endonuclease/exonuclease/phosphatase family protein [Vibrio sp.]|uniref:endonuclease/exonuclease/phosphatase family protein n=1 Tax=Vibrio sp. TaxID=678 RepID=UPI003D150D16
MRKTKRLLALLVVISIGLVSLYQLLFYVPESAGYINLDSGCQLKQSACFQANANQPLDQSGRINVLVWNIYKQNRTNWQAQLDQYADGRQLLLLQEASLSDALVNWIDTRQWRGFQAHAFSVAEQVAGVLNLSRSLPFHIRVLTQMEPWFQLPKSALLVYYPLSDGQQLAVVNLHAVNFTLGLEEYREQLANSLAELQYYRGPILVAGDFNSWSEARMTELNFQMVQLGLTPVLFKPDHRSRVLNGNPLDHIYYRGLNLVTAEAPETDASDHNPLLVSFSLSE